MYSNIIPLLGDVKWRASKMWFALVNLFRYVSIRKMSWYYVNRKKIECAVILSIRFSLLRADADETRARVPATSRRLHLLQASVRVRRLLHSPPRTRAQTSSSGRSLAM